MKAAFRFPVFAMVLLVASGAFGQVPAVRIWPVGDSITEGCCQTIGGGYRTELYNLLTNAGYNVDFVGTLFDPVPPSGLPDVYHEGHDGYRIDEIATGLDAWSSMTDDPDVVLLHIGTNDAAQEYNMSQAPARLQALIEQIETLHPAAKIIVASIICAGAARTNSDGTLTESWIDGYNQNVPGVVSSEYSAGKQVYFTDIHRVFTTNDLEFPDTGLHPSVTGYAVMATNWFGAITNVIGPYGTTNPPVILRVNGQADLAHVVVTFSKPISNGSASAGNFSLSGGASVLQASLDNSQRVITLTTTPLAVNTAYTLTVRNVQDQTPQANTIASNTAANFQSSPVAEAVNYSLVYSLRLPNQANYGSNTVPYTIDNHASVGSFDRVAYYLTLQPDGGSVQYLWVSMNAFTSNPSLIGVPNQSGAFFQQLVTNMNVLSSVSTITNGNGLGGNIEFWWGNYGPQNSANVPNASNSVYDWGDSSAPTNSAGYGSMQVHNYNAKQTLFAYNGWGDAPFDGYDNNAQISDVGIGNAPGSNTDWTQIYNATNYVVKQLQVYVLPVNTLTVNSSPASGVNFSASPADDNGRSGGTTGFSLSYGNGSIVTLTAPLTAGGNFQSWQSNGVFYSSSASVNVTVRTNYTITAVYAPWNVTVNSQSPNSGVNVTATQDTQGRSGGLTPTGLTYTNGTSVSLSAPAVAANGNVFQNWQTNGVSAGSSTTLGLTVSTNYTITAVYAPWNVTVNSQSPNSGVNVTATQDTQGRSGGLTPTGLTYTNGTSVSLSAPAVAANGNVFQNWQTNGVSAGSSTTLGLTVSTNYTITAVYAPWNVTVNSQSPNNGVNVTATQDTQGRSGGLTPIGLTYTNGTSVSLSAPAVAANGNVFQNWQTNGVSAGSSTTLGLTVSTNYTITAVYAPWNVTVNSQSPNSGVNVTATQDTQGRSGGLTPTGLTYTNGTSVSLSAPAVAANGNVFQNWQTNGVSAGSSTTLGLTVSTNYTITAVYAPWNVTVNSQSPNSGVNVTATQDTQGRSGGLTPTGLTYTNGTSVSLSAPAVAANGNVFQNWQTNGVSAGSSTTLGLTVSTNYTITAVYAPWNVTVNSQSPNSGVNVTATKDTQGRSGGLTPTGLTYTNGTSVSLSAPAVAANGNVFQNWQTNGVSAGSSTTLGLTVSTNYTITAVYAPWNVTVNSQSPNSGVNVTATQDTQGRSGGLTPTGLTYTNGTSVSLSAPAVAANGNVFQNWQTNGVSAGSSTTLGLTVSTNYTITAVYAPWNVTVNSQSPNSGVNVTATQDTQGRSGGLTPTGLTYTNGTSVSLSAPAVAANGNVFQNWQTNGVSAGSSTTLGLTVSTNYTITAVYAPWNVTVNSQSPNSGVNVTATQDTQGRSGGLTPTGLTYTNGTSVSLSAPAVAANGNVFQNWQTNGVSAGSSTTLGLTVSTNYTITAVYAPWNVTVNSQSPNSGVNVTATQDTQGRSGGLTPIGLTYTNGTSVSLSAPAVAANGNVFQNWQTNGVSAGSSTTLGLTVSTNYTITAVYAPWNVTVNSQSPNSGVNVTATQDTQGRSGGLTPTGLTYTNGTSVSLSAPAVAANGNVFQNWQTNGVSAGSSTTLGLTVSTNYTITAVYAPWNVTVNSLNPTNGVSVSASPSDTQNQAGGTTSFTLLYTNGTAVTLRAPGAVGQNYFQKWQTNGVDSGTATNLNLTVNTNYTVTAIYGWSLMVNSVNPGSGVSTTLNPTDSTGLGSGNTTLTRIYTNGTVVNMTAAPMASGNHFQKWQTNGVDYSTSTNISLTMNTNIIATAFYVPWNLNVQSIDPSSGISVAVSPPDTGGLSNGTTGFARTYTDGTVVSLTAAATAGLNTFQKWQTNGVDYSTSPATNLAMNADYTATAVYVSSVLGAYVFYNNSAWDNNDPTANTNDDNAIAPDKSPLMAGGVGSFTNYTSYSRGINGVMIDISAVPGVLTLNDFSFKIGNNNTPSTWVTAPSPTTVALRKGAGTNGSDRVTLIWPDNAIEKEWLEVTVAPTANTGLASPDIFFFGNAIGECGNSKTDAWVTSADIVTVINTVTIGATLTTPTDFNRDKLVSSIDVVIAIQNVSAGPSALQLIDLSGGLMAQVPGGTSSAGGGAALMSSVQSPASPTRVSESSSWLVESAVEGGLMRLVLAPVPSGGSTTIRWSPDLGRSGWRDLPAGWTVREGSDGTREIRIPLDEMGGQAFFLIDRTGQTAQSGSD